MFYNGTMVSLTLYGNWLEKFVLIKGRTAKKSSQKIKEDSWIDNTIFDGPNTPF